jgi:hypothetical protein
MSVSVPLTSFFNDVKICVASFFMYGVSHGGKYCTKFLNQYSFICSKFYKLYKYNINISHNKTTGLRNSFNKHVNKTLVWPHDIESLQGSTFCLFVMVQPWNIGVCWIDQVFVMELTFVIFFCSCSRFEYKNSI